MYESAKRARNPECCNMEKILRTMLAVSAVLACSSVSVTAVTSTLLVPENQNVSLGGTIKMWCMMIGSQDLCSGTEYEGVLYKVVEGIDVRHLSIHNFTLARSVGGRMCNVTTVFEMTATSNSGGTYGCFPAQVGQQDIAPIVKLRDEVTVRVCEDPQLGLHHNSVPAGTSGTINLSATTQCDFRGALTWRVNGVRVPLASEVSQGAEQPAVTQREDDSLVINNTAMCEGKAARVSRCNITAEYTYILERRIRVSKHSTEMLGCCIGAQEGEEEEVPTTIGKSKVSGMEYRSTETEEAVPTVFYAAVSVLSVCTLVLLATTCYYRVKWKNSPRADY